MHLRDWFWRQQYPLSPSQACNTRDIAPGIMVREEAMRTKGCSKKVNTRKEYRKNKGEKISLGNVIPPFQYLYSGNNSTLARGDVWINSFFCATTSYNHLTDTCNQTLAWSCTDRSIYCGVQAAKAELKAAQSDSSHHPKLQGSNKDSRAVVLRANKCVRKKPPLLTPQLSSQCFLHCGKIDM